METNTIVTDSSYNSLFLGESRGDAQEPRLACWVRLRLFGGRRWDHIGLSLQVSRCQRFKQVPCFLETLTLFGLEASQVVTMNGTPGFSWNNLWVESQ